LHKVLKFFAGPRRDTIVEDRQPAEAGFWTRSRGFSRQASRPRTVPRAAVDRPGAGLRPACWRCRPAAAEALATHSTHLTKQVW